LPMYVTHRQIVVPGELIAEGKYEVGGHVYSVGRKYYSKVLGVAEVISEEGKVRVIPLKGKYIPSVGDIVIGKIIDVGLANWVVDINSPYPAVLQVSEVFSRPIVTSKASLAKVLDIGDVIIAKVIAFDYARDPLLTIKESKLGKVTRGTLVEITPSKVPRVIGKKGSMVKMIKELLDVDLVIGKNGRILILGKDKDWEAIAALAIKKIELEAHTLGLTDRVKDYIKSLLEKEER